MRGLDQIDRQRERERERESVSALDIDHRLDMKTK